jgi:hypothetical protein
MTEEEWLASDDRQPMLEFLRGKQSDRKLRLFACACCRQIWDHLVDDSRGALVVVERFAEGAASLPELSQAQDVAIDAARTAEGEAVWMATSSDAFSAAFEASFCAAGQEACLGWPGRNENDQVSVVQEHTTFAALLRDIFGNPFRPVTFDPRWRTSDVVGLAQAIYDDKAFERMPILADALMDAGCEDEQVIGHCRGDGPYVRGCWVVDLVLGKE